MYKLLILIALAFSTIVGLAQFPNSSKAIGTGIYQKDTIIKSQTYKVYKGTKGGRYYISQRVSDPTIWDRRYIKK